VVTDDPESAAEAGARRAELHEAALSGLPWFAAARMSVELLALIASVALARLLTPAEIGHAVIALVFGSLTGSIFGEGMTTALTQRRREDQSMYEAASFAAVFFGVLLTIVVATGGAALASVLFGADTAQCVVFIAPLFLISALGVVPRARLQRRLAFPRMGAIETVSTLVALLVSVGLAAGGWDGRSMIVGNVASGVVGTLGLWHAARNASPRPHRRELRELREFGLPASLGSMLYLGLRNVDYWIIGAVLSARQVGLYFRAFTLGQDYQGKISGIMLRMALPIYSRAEDIEHMRSIRMRIGRTHAVVLFPLLASLAVVAPAFVPWFYGPQWEGAVVPTQILAVAGMVAAVLSGTGPLILALGRARAMMWWNAGVFVLYASVVFATAQIGLIAVCIGVLGFQLVNFVGAHVLLLQRIAGIPFRRSLAEIAPAGACAAALVAVAWPVFAALRSIDAPTAITLVVSGLVGIGVYLALLRAAFPAAFADVNMIYGRIAPKLSRLRRRPAVAGS
jgi:O-antigen/teichoic acid export membrane protein